MYASQNWKGKTLEAFIQAAPDGFEEPPDRLVIEEENVLKVYVEGRDASNVV